MQTVAKRTMTVLEAMDVKTDLVTTALVGWKLRLERHNRKSAVHWGSLAARTRYRTARGPTFAQAEFHSIFGVVIKHDATLYFSAGIRQHPVSLCPVLSRYTVPSRSPPCRGNPQDTPEAYLPALPQWQFTKSIPAPLSQAPVQHTLCNLDVAPAQHWLLDKSETSVEPFSFALWGSLLLTAVVEAIMGKQARRQALTQNQAQTAVGRPACRVCSATAVTDWLLLLADSRYWWEFQHTIPT